MRSTLKATVMTGIVVAASAVASLAASPAFAASNVACTGVSGNGGGTLCIRYDPAGYRASYLTWDEPRGDLMDFNLVCFNGHTYGDNGAFSAQKSNHAYTYVFAVGNQGWCKVAMYDRTTYEQWVTANIDPTYGP